MSDKNLEKVESVFHAALELPVADRRLYLQQVCNGDEALFAEVSSLLTSVESSNGFMEQPALTAGLNVLLNSSKDSLIGKSLGFYKIVAPLGQGGMGDVYLAEDTRLNRNVALKFLSMEFIADNWGKRQLLKEAQSVAMLDHPNICQVYGIENHEQRSFIVMQYVKGTTLAELIRRRSLTVAEVLSLAKQIVGALAEAHAHGIIHRDIKPKNIMVTPTQQVRVLDFGLAKTVQRMKGIDIADDSISNLTQAGLLEGTVAYMSPEQLRGEKLDYRSDVFSVGIVLYEMLSGKNPFAHQNSAETISAILSHNPDTVKTSSVESRALARLVDRCLQKKREDRFQSASELLVDLDSVSRAIAAAEVQPRRIGPRFAPKGRLFRFALTLAFIGLFFLAGYFVYSQVMRAKSVAILPIENETGDPKLDYLANGLTETISAKLSRLSKLRIPPSTRVARYKGQGFDPARIGQELGVDGLLVASIIGNSETHFLRAKLVSGDGSVLWDRQYGLDMVNVFVIETEVAQSITSTMEFMSADDERLVQQTAVGPANPDARQFYWLGQYYWSRRGSNQKTLDEAIQHFKKAIELEPTYAEAHAGLADCYAYLNVVAYGRADTKEAMSMAVRAAKDALYLNPNLVQARTSLATVYTNYYWDWEGAEQQFKLAIKTDPTYAPARYGYSRLLTIRGRHAEAIQEAIIARELDPFSAPTILNHCRTLFFARKFDESVGCYDKLVDEHPDYDTGRYVRGWVYFHVGRSDEAVATFEELYPRNKRLAGAALGFVYGQRGRKDEAEAILREMLLLTKDNLPPQEIALIYLGLGDMNNARIWFEETAKAHFIPFAFLIVDPMFEKLRAEEWFLSLVKTYDRPFPHPPPS